LDFSGRSTANNFVLSYIMTLVYSYKSRGNNTLEKVIPCSSCSQSRVFIFSNITPELVENCKIGDILVKKGSKRGENSHLVIGPKKSVKLNVNSQGYGIIPIKFIEKFGINFWAPAKKYVSTSDLSDACKKVPPKLSQKGTIEIASVKKPRIGTFESMTKQELLDRAKDKNIKNRHTMTKEELISKLRGN